MGKILDGILKVGVPQGTWSSKSIYILNEKFKTYLNAPLVVSFGSLKEEATKFIMSHYQKGKLWLSNLVEITPKRIVCITSLPTSRHLVPMMLNNCPLIEGIIGRKVGKNSKGLMINQIQKLSIKWTTIITSNCLKILG